MYWNYVNAGWLMDETRRENSSLPMKWMLSRSFSQKCCHCGEALDTDHNPGGGKYLRYQMTDIPKITPYVTEYRLRCLRRRCGIDTSAELPDYARSGFGPNLTTSSAYLTGVHSPTRRGNVDVFKTIFGVAISLGSVCYLHQEMSHALKTSYEEINGHCPNKTLSMRTKRDRGVW
jgi:hypothetical protein